MEASASVMCVLPSHWTNVWKRSCHAVLQTMTGAHRIGVAGKHASSALNAWVECATVMDFAQRSSTITLRHQNLKRMFWCRLVLKEMHVHSTRTARSRLFAKEAGPGNALCSHSSSHLMTRTCRLLASSCLSWCLSSFCLCACAILPLDFRWKSNRYQ